MHVLRAKADEARNQGERAVAREYLEKAEALAEEELSNYRDLGDDLGQGCMLLCLAEATCAYRGSNKREEASSSPYIGALSSLVAGAGELRRGP